MTPSVASDLSTLTYRVGQLEQDVKSLEDKLDGLRRVLMGLIVTIASSSLLLLVTLLLTGGNRR